MKVAYIMNCLNKSEVTPHVTAHNFECAGHEIEYSIFTNNGSTEKAITGFVNGFATHPITNKENIGNPQALNNAMRLAFKVLNVDAVVIAGNDITMPRDWLREAIDAYNKIEDTGLIGWSWRNDKSNVKQKGKELCVVGPDQRVFGSWFLPKRTFEKCGYFSTFSKYGLWDSTYNIQVHQASMLRYYLADYPSNHSMADDTGWYRQMKDEELSKGAEGNAERMKQIKEQNKFYVTFDNLLR